MTVSSKTNPGVKRVRALKQRKEREATGLFFVEGIRLVGEAVELGAPVEQVIVAPDLLRSDYGLTLVDRIRAAGGGVLEVSGEVFQGIATREHPAGIGAVVQQRWQHLADIDPRAGLCWVVLESPADPGNVGTILRTADAVGAAGIILVGEFTDPYDPTAVRAGMGAIFSQHLVKAEVPDLALWKAQKRVHVVGTSDAADMDYVSPRYDAPLLLLMGSERQGLSTSALRICDEVVRIPMVGRGDSLNLAVATGLMLYAVFERRRSR